MKVESCIPVLENNLQFFIALAVQYSLQQKECLTTLDEKSSFFFDGQYLWKIASKYLYYEYIYKYKKPAAARRFAAIKSALVRAIVK